MSADSPASILYDADGHPVGVVLDGAVYRLRTEAKLAIGHGLATEANQTNGSQKAVVRSGAKGTTVAADVTSENVDTNVQALHVRTVRVPGGPDQQVRIVDGSGNPLDTPDESNPATVNGLMMGGWEEVTNRLHRIAVDSQGRVLTISAGKLGNMIDLFYRNTIGAYVANQFRRVLEYVVPAGYAAYLTRYSSWQNETAYSRVAAETCFGTLNVATNVFTAESAYIAPQFSSINEAVVTTPFGAANNVTITVTYTNNLGVGGRTGTITIPKSSIAGTRVSLVLQAGDLGVRSVQSMSASPSGGAGAIELCGFIQFSFHFDLSATQGVETSFAVGSISFPAGTVLIVEFSGGTVAKERILNAQIQLVTA